jgi:hypothetical protein
MTRGRYPQLHSMTRELEAPMEASDGTGRGRWAVSQVVRFVCPLA